MTIDHMKSKIDQMIEKKHNEKILELIRVFSAYIMEMKIKGKLSDKDVDKIIIDLNRVLNGI